MASDVIAAIATPPGRGGIGIVRVSGPQLKTMLRALTGREPVAREATRAAFKGASGEVIDEGLLLYFPAPHSYTGEDVIELQGHGGTVVLNLLLQRCLELGARLALPGEFTQRAYLNDKIDLAQAEGVADLIDASTAQAARCAMRSLQGEFSQRIDRLVGALTDLRVSVEATLDFPEEEIELLQGSRAHERLAVIQMDLAALIAASQKGRLLRDGIHVVLVGQPNVGKSSLLNALARTERAIVTDIPGTTRDAIRETISLDGVPLHVTDTAGIRMPRDPVEKIGIERTWQAVADADLVLWISDVTRPQTSSPDEGTSLQLPKGVTHLYVRNKIDAVGLHPDVRTVDGRTEVAVSARTRAGLNLLEEAILKAAGWGSANEGTFMARERHLQALHRAKAHIASAIKQSEPELLAEELGLAQRALGDITGVLTASEL